MITTRDIALAAGVSQSTVSRALRNHPGIPPKTCHRLQELAISMGYKPNPLVSALMAHQRSGKAVTERHVMAYLTTDVHRNSWKSIHTYVDFHKGAAERAASYGFDLEEFWLGEPRMTAHRMSQILYNRNIQGVLIAPLRSDRMAERQSGRGHLSLDWKRFSIGTLGYTMIRPRVHRAVHNHLLGIRLALRQLQKLGYRRIGLVLQAAHDARVDYNWSTGFAKYLMSQRPSARTVPFIRQDSHYNFTEFTRWFEQQKPDALICGIWEVYRWMQAAGIRTPEDVGLALLDQGKNHAMPIVPAGIDQNSTAVGAAAVDMIVGQLNRNERGLPDIPKITLIEGFWVSGATVRPQ